MKYKLTVQTDTNGWPMITSELIPEFVWSEENLQDTIYAALPAFLVALDNYIRERVLIPVTTNEVADPDGHYLIIPTIVSLKIQLFNECIQQGITIYGLGKKLGMAPSQIARLFDLETNTDIETIIKAFDALGKQVRINVF